MKFKFMRPRQAKKDQHTFKEKIEKQRIEKEEIKTTEAREIEEKEKGVKKKIMEKLVENKVFNRSHPCSVAFVYESNNNVVSQRFVEKLK